MNVGEMQTKLSRWAEQDRERRFADLYNLLYDKAWLQTAYEHVRRNAGSQTAGSDGLSMHGFEEHLEGNLDALRAALKAGTFEPMPVRRVYIPKHDGRQRPLGVPTITDRIVQEVLRMILEPIYEADFSPHSYGFRPNRCTTDAVEYLGRRLTGPGRSYGWVIEGDIAACFDTIHHRKLMKLLGKRIGDARLLDLIWKFLRAGVLEKGAYHETLAGTPQGGIVSPLLANIYLHELDRHMERHYLFDKQERRRRRHAGQANFLYVRYADDWAVLCNGTRAQAEATRHELQTFLAQTLRLTLSMAKTKVTHITEGFHFLGFHLVRSRGQHGTLVPKIQIPASATARLRAKIKHALAPHTTHDSVRAKIVALNRIIGGWCRYYQYSSGPSRMFGRLTHELFWLMAHWLGRKYRTTIGRVMRKYGHGSTFAVGTTVLIMPAAYPGKRYLVCAKLNPYTHQTALQREAVISLAAAWTGTEDRKGMLDRRAEVLKRDGQICAVCGTTSRGSPLEVDHLTPRVRFKRPHDADCLENLQVLCKPCHTAKTQSDRQVLSRVRSKPHARF
jgi:RNA-directed DNA polymerase